MSSSSQSILTGKRVLFLPFNLLSHHLRCIELAKRTAPSQSIFPSRTKYDQFTLREGFETVELADFDPEAAVFGLSQFSFSWLDYSNLRMMLESQVAIINQVRPDVVVVDAALTGRMACELTGVPSVSVLNAYMSNHFEGSWRLPHRRVLNRLNRLFPRALGHRLDRVGARYAFKRVHRPFRRLRREMDLGTTNNLLDEFEADWNFIVDLPTVFRLHNPPRDRFTVIQLVYQFEEDGAPPEPIDTVLPTVCVVMGSSGNWSAISPLSNLAGKSFNMVICGEHAESLRGPNTLVSRFANLSALLPRVDAMIFPGGNGTMYQGITHGVPMICLPAHVEQEWNSYRLQALGLARVISKPSYRSFLQATQWAFNARPKMRATFQLLKAEMDRP